jgi:hypothetical protein
MAFTIPNARFANDDLAEPDKVDVDILVAGLAGDGVLSGCAVTAQGVPDGTVAVASGSVRVGGTVASVSSGNVTIPTGDATSKRFDLVAVDNVGAKSRVAGTPSTNPVFPTIPANSIVIAAVEVPALDTTIASDQIVDKRVLVSSLWPTVTNTFTAAQKFNSYLELGEIADPAAPAANLGRLFVRDNGAGKEQICIRFPTGAIIVLGTADVATGHLVANLPGTVATGAGAARFYNKLGRTLTVYKAWASVGTAPTGASLIVDINKNGTTIFTTQANRPTIAAGTNFAESGTPAVTTWADGDYVTFDVDQIGSTVAGSDLVVALLAA